MVARSSSTPGLTDIATRLDDTERHAEHLPHREKYLLLVTGFLHGFLELHEPLVDDIERHLAADGQARPRQRA